MKSFLLWGGLAVLAPILAVAGVVMLVPEWRGVALGVFRGEKFYEGRPSSEWAVELKSGWPKSADALQKGGAGAVPVLIQVLKDPDPISRGRAARVLARIGSKDAVPALVEAQQDKELVVRCLAACALAAIDPEGQRASVRAMLDHWSLKEPEPGFVAVVEKALACYPVEARLDGLAQALRSDSSHVRLKAILFLEEMGKPALPALKTALKDHGKDSDGSTLGERAALAIERTDPSVREAIVVELVAVLKDPAAADRPYAAYALGRFRAAARSAVPTLLEAARDKNSAVKTEAINALKLIDPAAAAEAGAIDF